jgi:tRNA/tmRNA/rRNA uracil-C5-methylase (TrmA/RlmC/RlmD family)
MQPGDTVELIVEKAAAGGRMLARHQGQVVLVSGAIPGERVRARVERAQRDVLLASTLDVVEAHPSRRCTNPDPACGGMTFAHIQADHQRTLKAQILADAFTRIAKIPLEGVVPVAESPETGYRMRTRLHVRAGRLGSFREGTHEVCDVSVTGQLLDASVGVLEQVGRVLQRHGVEWLDAVELTENLTATQRVLHVDEGRGPEIGPATWADLAGLEGVTGLTRASGRGRPLVVWGRGWVHDPVAAFAGESSSPEATLRRHATSFFQANRYLAPALAAAVLGRLLDGPVVDLYAGVGLFAVCAAAGGWRDVTAVEGDPTSALDLRRNAGPFRDTLRVVDGAVEAFVRDATPDADATLIVDPPRTGMSRAAMTGIVRAGARRIVYVSCDVATLARDVRRLGEVGYGVGRIEAFDLFPNTPHIESLVVLERERD